MRTPEIRVSSGSLEALKWFGLVAMTGDHVNKYLFNSTLPYLFEFGRLAMPIFGFVLAYNLARPGTLVKGIYRRVMIRLAIFGALACPSYIAMGGVLGHWWPLNILFTLLVATAMMALVDASTILDGSVRGSDRPAEWPFMLAAAAAFGLVGGAVVEFWWPALAWCFFAWCFFKRPTWPALVLALAGLASLYLVNKNWWALLTIPAIYLAGMLDLRVPRLNHVFYWYYPLHLAALWLIRIPMAAAGYLFFT